MQLDPRWWLLVNGKLVQIKAQRVVPNDMSWFHRLQFKRVVSCTQLFTELHQVDFGPKRCYLHSRMPKRKLKYVLSRFGQGVALQEWYVKCSNSVFGLNYQTHASVFEFDNQTSWPQNVSMAAKLFLNALTSMVFGSNVATQLSSGTLSKCWDYIGQESGWNGEWIEWVNLPSASFLSSSCIRAISYWNFCSSFSLMWSFPNTSRSIFGTLSSLQ